MSTKKPARPRKPATGAATGRPTGFTQEFADRFSALVATQRKGIRRLCAENPDLPCSETIRLWLHRHETFFAQYARAKTMQADLMEEEIVDISDDDSRDTIDGDNGPQPNSEWIARSKLRVDTRKWLMSKLAPKKYGEKLELGGNLHMAHAHLTLAELEAREKQAEEWEKK